MGSSGQGANQGNYSQQIQQGLDQANLPKSPLSQDISGTLQGSYLPALAGLLNAGNLGNAFPGTQSGMNSPGFVFNQNPIGFAGPSQSNGGSPNTGNTGGGGGNGGGGGGSDLTQFGYNPSSAYSSAPYGSNNANGAPQLNGPAGIPAYGGQMSYNYSSVFPGLDIANLPQGSTFKSLMDSGQLTADQVNQYMGKPSGYDPYSDPSNQTQYQQYIQGMQSNPNIQAGSLPNYNDWVNSNTYLGTNIASQAPQDQAGFNQWLSSRPASQLPASGAAHYLQNGQMLDANGNVINPNGQQTSSGVSGVPAYQNANPSLSQFNFSGPNSQALSTLQNPTGSLATISDPYTQNLLKTFNNTMMQQKADLNSRFGASGGASRGTPAEYANTLFDQNVYPQLAATLGAADQQSKANQLQMQGLNLQGANSALSNQLGFQSNQNSTTLGQNNLLANLAQFNAGQTNSLNQGYTSLQQQANQQQIQNQLAGLQNIMSLASSFGLSGIPGGGASINLGANSQGAPAIQGGFLNNLGSFYKNVFGGSSGAAAAGG